MSPDGCWCEPPGVSLIAPTEGAKLADVLESPTKLVGLAAMGVTNAKEGRLLPPLVDG